MDGFEGFPDATFAFLKGISANNNKDWFEAHRPLYEAGYVKAGGDFVTALGPRLQKLSPEVQFAPKINGSLSRINRDIRFSKDKRPYKDHLDFWFWHGDKRGWACPGFYLRLTVSQVFLGVGMHMPPKEVLDRMREVLSDPKEAEALQKLLAKVEKSGPYEIGGKNRKQLPRGYAAQGASSEMLLYDSLTAGLEWVPEVARSRDFADFCYGHFEKCWPVGDWLLRKVQPSGVDA